MGVASKDILADPWRMRRRGSPMWKNVAAPVVLVILFWLVSSLVTTYYIHWLEDSQAHSIKEDLGTVRAAGGMRYDLRQLYRVAIEARQNGNPAATAEARRFEDAFRTHLAAAIATSPTPEEREQIAAIHQNYPPFREAVHRWLESADRREMQTAEGVLQLTQLLDAVAEPCKQLSDVNERFIDAAAAQRSRVASSINGIRLAFLIVGPAGGILCGLWISKRFHRSISQISITLGDATSQIDQPLARIDLRPSGDLSHLHDQVQVVSARIRQVVEELQQARRQAIASARLAAVGELAAGVAHELRNPLTSVKLLIQMASHKSPQQPLPERQMRVIQEEIARMENTIETLLQFARPPQMKRLRHDLRETVRRAMNLVEGQANHANVTIDQELPADPVTVDADPEQLHQAITNLLLNGIEAMSDGGLLTITLRQDAASGRMCQIVVEDNGPGIPRHVMDRLFEPFVTGKERGTGLGLAISRRIVQENGGTLSAENRKEGGAVFMLELPAWESEAPAEPGVAGSRGSAGASPSQNLTEAAHA